MRAERVDRTTHNDSTNPLSVAAHAWVRECNGPPALGEVPVNALSDRGSTPLGSTKSAICCVAMDSGFFLPLQRIGGFFNHSAVANQEIGITNKESKLQMKL